MQSEVQNVFVSDDMARYIVSLISATRRHPLLSRGASPRATLSLTDMAKAVAILPRAEITLCREMVQKYFYLHRKPQDNSQRKSLCIKKNSEEILQEILRKTPKPRLENDKEHNNLSLSADGNIFVQHFLLRLVLMVFVSDGYFNSDNLAFAESAFYDTECTLRY